MQLHVYPPIARSCLDSHQLSNNIISPSKDNRLATASIPATMCRSCWSLTILPLPYSLHTSIHPPIHPPVHPPSLYIHLYISIPISLSPAHLSALPLLALPLSVVPPHLAPAHKNQNLFPSISYFTLVQYRPLLLHFTFHF